MFFQKSTLSIFVAAACILSHEAHAKSSSLRGANSDISNEGKRALSEDERSYFLVDERKNFGQAREYCKSLGMDLASITSAEENRIVAQLCESANSGSLCWTGLAPQWLDGTEYIYRNNESYLQNAVVISGKKRSWVDYGGWRYSKGNKERAFVCSDVIPEEISLAAPPHQPLLRPRPPVLKLRQSIPLPQPPRCLLLQPPPQILLRLQNSCAQPVGLPMGATKNA